MTLVYNDGRPGHSGVLGKVLSVGHTGFSVLWNDRCSPNWIAFSEREWMEHIKIKS